MARSTRRSRRSNRGRKKGGSGKAVLAIFLAGCAAAAWYGLRDTETSPDTRQANGTGQSGSTPRSTGLAGAGTASQAAADAVVGGGMSANAEIAARAASYLRQFSEVVPAHRAAFLKQAHAELVQLLAEEMSPATRLQVLPAFTAISDAIFFNTERNDFFNIHTVTGGESLRLVARKYGVTEELLCLWNGIDPAGKRGIQIGQRLKVPHGPVRLLVDKSDYTLSVLFGDVLVRQYVIAHGRGGNTPTGTATVRSREIDPDKTPGAGPAQQEMRERWIGLTEISGRSGIGIHGTAYEESIPGETSMGCVRMFNKQVIELYDWVPYGATVVIQD